MSRCPLCFACFARLLDIFLNSIISKFSACWVLNGQTRQSQQLSDRRQRDGSALSLKLSTKEKLAKWQVVFATRLASASFSRVFTRTFFEAPKQSGKKRIFKIENSRSATKWETMAIFPTVFRILASLAKMRKDVGDWRSRGFYK